MHIWYIELDTRFLVLTLSRLWGARTSPFDVYPAGKLQWHFILVVSILDIVYDCDLYPVLQAWKG